LSIRVNERKVRWAEGTTVGALRDVHAAGADILIVNGATVNADYEIDDGDRVVLIQRGVKPSAKELQALLVARHTPSVYERVRTAVIGIAGLGGLGSNVACCLARLGVGRLILADFDLVEPSNLNRQQYFIDQIGERKVDALAATLARINPYVCIDRHCVRLTEENIPRVFAGVHVMVECFDEPEAKTMALGCARTAMSNVHWVLASGLAGYGCSNDLRLNRLFDNVLVAGDTVTGARPGRGLMSPRVTICAGIQANAVLRLLLGLPVPGDTIKTPPPQAPQA